MKAGICALHGLLHLPFDHHQSPMCAVVVSVSPLHAPRDTNIVHLLLTAAAFARSSSVLLLLCSHTGCLHFFALNSQLRLLLLALAGLQASGRKPQRQRPSQFPHGQAQMAFPTVWVARYHRARTKESMCHSPQQVCASNIEAHLPCTLIPSLVRHTSYCKP